MTLHVTNLHFVIVNIVSFISMYILYVIESYNKPDMKTRIFLASAVFFSIVTGIGDYYLSKRFNTNIPLTLFMFYGVAELAILLFIRCWASLDENDDSDDYEEDDDDIDL